LRDKDFGRHFGGRHRHWGRHGFGGFAGMRARRGDIKYEILAVLQDGPRHGYDIMLAIEQRRGGFRPSAGSIYPSLQLLEDEGLLSSTEVDGKRVYTLTDKGRASLDERAKSEDAQGSETQAEGDLHETIVRGFKALRGIAMAAKQVARSGDADAIKRCVDVLDRARRELYEIVADAL
jgi:DNA-binding PadR family transcriptional regulator